MSSFFPQKIEELQSLLKVLKILLCALGFSFPSDFLLLDSNTVLQWSFLRQCFSNSCSVIWALSGTYECVSVPGKVVRTCVFCQNSFSCDDLASLKAPLDIPIPDPAKEEAKRKKKEEVRLTISRVEAENVIQIRFFCFVEHSWSV